MSKIIYMTDAWLITCVVSTGTEQSNKMLLAARDAGAKGAFGHYARGYGARERFGALGVAVETEKDVISVLVSTDQRDMVFEAMYKAGGLDRPGAGIMYITPIDKAASYVPESVLTKLKEADRVKEADRGTEVPM